MPSDHGADRAAEGLRYSVLGPLRAWRGDEQLSLARARQRAVLVALLLRAGTVVSVERLIDDVWGPDAPNTALSALRSYIHWLRRTLQGEDGDPIRTDGGGYALHVARDALDLTSFERALAQANTHRLDGRIRDALESYTQALKLVGGMPLADVPGPYAEAQRTRLDGLHLEAVEGRAACLLALGDAVGAAGELAAFAAENPLRERLQELWMLALHRTGRRAEALSAYRATRRALSTQLGVEPSGALQSMHRRILAADPSLDAAADSSSGRQPRRQITPAQLPSAPAVFVGRDDQRAEVLGLAGTPVLVHGPAGVGKTTFALHVAHLLAPRYPDGQLFADLRGFGPRDAVRDPAAVLAQFLDALGVSANDLPHELSARSALYRTLLAGRRILIVLDNARDPEQVRPLLPGAAGCLVVVTSRKTMPGLAVTHQARQLALPLFDTREAHEYLDRTLGRERIVAEPTAADRIVASCAGLPLALAITAAHAAQAPAFPLAQIAQAQLAARGRLDAFVLGDDPAVNVRAVFSWSYDALSSGAARLLRLISVHPGPRVTPYAAAALLAGEQRTATRLLAELADAHLLVERNPGRYAVHDLIRAYATELSQERDDAGERDEARYRLLDHYIHTAHLASRLLTPGRSVIPLAEARPGTAVEQLADLSQALAWFGAEYRVILTLLKTCDTHHFDEQARQLAWAVENYFGGRSLRSELYVSQRIALTAAQRLGDPAIEARASRGLARAEARLGRFDKAREHLEHALRLLGEDSSPVTRAETHRLLSWVLEEGGARHAALPHLRRSLRLNIMAGEGLGMANSLNSLGWCLAKLGHFHQTLVCCFAALRIVDEIGEKQAAANTWDSIAYAHHGLGHHDAAVAAYERAVALFRLLDSRFEQAQTLDCLGDVHLSAHRPWAARTAWSEALEILDRIEELEEADRMRAKLAQLDGDAR